jgi:hypothetical protein
MGRRLAGGPVLKSEKPGLNNRASQGEILPGAVFKITFCRVAPFLFSQYPCRIIVRHKPLKRTIWTTQPF